MSLIQPTAAPFEGDLAELIPPLRYSWPLQLFFPALQVSSFSVECYREPRLPHVRICTLCRSQSLHQYHGVLEITIDHRLESHAAA